MDLGIQDRVAAVAASSRGLGFGAAAALARDGARVAICGRRESALEEAVEQLTEITGDSDRVHAVNLDAVADPEGFVEATVGHFGALDIAVPNAGGPPPGRALDHDADAYRDAIEANCVASIRMAQAAVPHMREAGWGRICFIASITIKDPAPLLALSNTARAGLAAFAKTLAGEVAADGINVTMALPGTHDTDRIRELGADAMDEMAAGVPVGRIGDPADFGSVVAFLCSEPANYVTGTTVAVDGGRFSGLL